MQDAWGGKLAFIGVTVYPFAKDLEILGQNQTNVYTNRYTKKVMDDD